MKAFLILCISGAVLAQTPAPVKKAAPAAATTTPAAGAAKAAAAPAKTAAPPAVSPALLNPKSPSLNAKAPELFRVKFTTTHGDFVVEAHRDWAPLGVDRFYNLVKAGFFKDNAFYRYSPNFIVQFGAHANPAVTAAWANAKIKDDPFKQSNKKGTLTFATSGPNSRTTDFFINLKDNTPLDTMGFTAIGMVTEGMDVVEGLYSGYGEMKEMNNPSGVSQAELMSKGKPYLDKNFPKLDSIKTATIIFPEPGTPAAAPKKEAAPATKAPAPATKSATPAAPAKK